MLQEYYPWTRQLHVQIVFVCKLFHAQRQVCNTQTLIPTWSFTHIPREGFNQHAIESESLWLSECLINYKEVEQLPQEALKESPWRVNSLVGGLGGLRLRFKSWSKSGRAGTWMWATQRVVVPGDDFCLLFLPPAPEKYLRGSFILMQNKNLWNHRPFQRWESSFPTSSTSTVLRHPHALVEANGTPHKCNCTFWHHYRTEALNMKLLLTMLFFEFIMIIAMYIFALIPLIEIMW